MHEAQATRLAMNVRMRLLRMFLVGLLAVFGAYAFCLLRLAAFRFLRLGG